MVPENITGFTYTRLNTAELGCSYALSTETDLEWVFQGLVQPRKAYVSGLGSQENIFGAAILMHPFVTPVSLPDSLAGCREVSFPHTPSSEGCRPPFLAKSFSLCSHYSSSPSNIMLPYKGELPARQSPGSQQVQRCQVSNLLIWPISKKFLIAKHNIADGFPDTPFACQQQTQWPGLLPGTPLLDASHLRVVEKEQGNFLITMQGQVSSHHSVLSLLYHLQTID